MKLRFGLQFKLLFFIILLIILALSLLGWFVIKEQRKTLELSFRERARAISQTLDASIGTRSELEDREKLQSMIYKLIWLNPDIISIIISLPTPEGLKIIAANDFSSVDQPSDSEGLLSYEKGITLTKTSRESDDSKALSVFTPVHLAGQRVGIYNIKLSLQSLEKSIAQTQKQFFFLVVGSIFFIIILLFLVLKKEVINPIYELKEGMAMVGKGNFDYKIETRKEDEIGELAKGLNEMSGELKGLYQSLEEKVAKRTAQLNEKVKELEMANEELERFNKLAVGREVKMIELKEEIKKLEEELEEIKGQKE